MPGKQTVITCPKLREQTVTLNSAHVHLGLFDTATCIVQELVCYRKWISVQYGLVANVLLRLLLCGKWTTSGKNTTFQRVE